MIEVDYHWPLVHLQGMIEDLQAAPEGAIVILHACAHNPTGAKLAAVTVHGVERGLHEDGTVGWRSGAG